MNDILIIYNALHHMERTTSIFVVSIVQTRHVIVYWKMFVLVSRRFYGEKCNQGYILCSLKKKGFSAYSFSLKLKIPIFIGLNMTSDSRISFFVSPWTEMSQFKYGTWLPYMPVWLELVLGNQYGRRFAYSSRLF